MRMSIRLPAVVTAFGFSLVIVGQSQAQEVRWRHDYAAACREAKETSRPMLLDFGTAGCSWCRKLDSTTFRSPAIARLLGERLIPVKVDAEENPRLAQTLGVQAFPTLIIASSEGKVISRHEGYVDAGELQPILDRALSKMSRQQTMTAATESGSSQDFELSRCRVVIVGPTESKPRGLVMDAQRALTARSLLEQAQRDLDAGLLMACLDRCSLLMTDYSDLAPANDAQMLVDRIAGDTEALERSRKRLGSVLGDMYLKRSVDLRSQGNAAAADACLERAERICPDSAAIQAARNQSRNDRVRGSAIGTSAGQEP